ncbi:hypothetical protein AAL_05147 [Moelleriella libera RCEF 2490]|uniref:Fe2OG dioxygenase domain-containing protein n=1 Tax=Moelleriella libera RCEF 2490 TaxID=1081109 RepID=A0A166P3H3_9HYPO|nr:hypothetical protein AAL_05147 [Moelleriella libera RCEF 2490]
MPDLILNRSPPAPTVIGPATKSATRPTTPLPRYLIDEARLTQKVPFDAAQHLNFQPPTQILSMKDIGLEGHGISPNAVSEPFRLFSDEAIKQIRAEVFDEETLKDCQFASDFNKNMVRGMGPRRAPFTYAAWNSPKLLSYVSQVAGVELVPSIDFEIANINISVSDGLQENIITEPRDGEKDRPLGDGISSVAWHYDSFPFVCVVMLSDCTGMLGGETALRTASGEILKVRGPAMGTAVVLQGRYIEHQALKALGGRERISMVTCFRPKSPHVKDETVLTGVRGISYKSELYTQYMEYRLDILQERVRAKAKAEQLRERAGVSMDIVGVRDWLADQKDFIQSMLCEITEE